LCICLAVVALVLFALAAIAFSTLRFMTRATSGRMELMVIVHGMLGTDVNFVFLSLPAPSHSLAAPVENFAGKEVEGGVG
jgi:uncharacterized membrane protein YwzB